MESPCRDLSLPQVPREFLKKPVTMPGALFPRSPSLDPDYASAIEEQHRVHFALGTPNPSFRSYSDLMREATDGSPSTFHVDPPKVGDIPRHDPTASPVRANGGPSVKGAIERFADDADHSLMLPNLTTSPGRAAPLSSPQRVDGTAEIASLSSKAKGKQRAMDWDYNFAEANTTGEIRVRGKEQELLEAREEHIRKEQDRELDPDQSAYFEEREKDKERIRALEAEVVQLKEQVCDLILRECIPNEC